MDRLASSFLLVGLSVFIYGLAAAVHSRYQAHLFALDRVSADWRGSAPLLKGISYHLLRILYYIGLPYAALRLGIIPINWMGLGGWTATENEVLKTLALMLTILVLTLVTWRGYARCRDSLHDWPMSDIPAAWPISVSLGVVYLQVHWAFYRSAALLWMGGDYHAGIWLGFVLVVLEELLSSQIRRNIVRLDDASLAVGIRWALVASSGVAFMLSRSLWFVALLHWAIELINLAVRRKLSHRQSPHNGRMAT